jgi:hypothetical protein
MLKTMKCAVSYCGHTFLFCLGIANDLISSHICIVSHYINIISMFIYT